MLSNGDFARGTGSAPDSWLLNYNINATDNPAQWGEAWVWDGSSKATHTPGNVFALVQKSTHMLSPILPDTEYKVTYTISGCTQGSVTL
jgi:hypothetical protein